MTAAAMRLQEYVWAQRSYRVWMRRQSLRRPKMFLDLMALFVEDGVMRDRGFAVGFGRNAGGDAALGEGGAEPVGVITLVGQKALGFRHGRRRQRGALVVAHLPLA